MNEEKNQRAPADTICAVSTPPGAGGIGVIRVSGPETYALLERVFRDRHGRRVPVTRLPTHVVRYGFIWDRRRRRDEVLLTIMRGPRSYTREDMAEIGCHGGFAALRGVMETLLGHGCRLAGPGEFTRRAFLSGRLDLLQAEAVLALVNSRTSREQAAALEQLRGGAGRPLADLEACLGALLADLDAAIDFPGETAGQAVEGLGERLDDVGGRLRAFAGSLEQGRLLAEGIRTAVIGRPNVGKSCLLNALLARRRAIVSAVPGTTRDEISETLIVGGYPLTLIDTAGIRAPRNSVEAEGVRRSRAWLARAELVLLVLDRARRLTAADRALLAAVPPARTILVLNKSDRPDRLGAPGKPAACPRVSVSALTGAGLEELRGLIAGLVGGGKIFPAGGDPVFLDLQRREKLAEAAAAVRAARQALDRGLPLEFPAADLRRAAGALAAVTGRDVAAETLDLIFSRFCIGK